MILGRAVAKKLQVDEQVGSMVGMFLLGEGLIDISFETTITFGLIICIWYYGKTILKWFSKKTSHICIYNDYDISFLMNYIQEFPIYFSSDFGSAIGKRNSLFEYSHSSRKYFDSNQTIQFHDTDLNISGYIKTYLTKQITVKDGKNIENSEVYPTLYIYSDTMTAADYFDNIKIKYKKSLKLQKNVKLIYNKVFGSKDEGCKYHTLKLYNGLRKTTKDDRMLLFKYFFHTNKETLLNTFERIHFNPDFYFNRGQVPGFRAIFHGPPGTGKSMIIERIAKAYKRHIISIDLTTITKKLDVYRIIQKPRINNRICDPDEYILLFEEFDNTIKYLKKQEEDNELSMMEWYMNTNKTEDKDKDKNKISGYQKDSEKFTIRDLLEIFQGPVSRPGQIMIATTNNLKDMKESYPALFRHGRLSPIEFGYLQAPEINKMIKLYFDSDLTIDFNPNIASSQLIEMINELSLEKNGAEKFIEKLKKNVN